MRKQPEDTACPIVSGSFEPWIRYSVDGHDADDHRRGKPAYVFVAVEHANSEIVGIHAARSANRFEALEPVRLAPALTPKRLQRRFARAALAVLRRQQADLSIGWIRANVPYQTPKLIERYVEAMRKAGLK